MAEVVGFKEEKIILMPYTNLQEIGPGSLVEATARPLEIKVGHELIGKVVDSLGNPLDDSIIPVGLTVVTERTPPNPLSDLQSPNSWKWVYGQLIACLLWVKVSGLGYLLEAELVKALYSV